MRVAVGPIKNVGSNGVDVRTDQQLSVEQVDFLLGLLAQHGRCRMCVSAVEVSEAGVVIEPSAIDDITWFKHCQQTHPLPGGES